MAATRTARSWHAQRPLLWRRLASIRVWTTASAVEKVAFAFDDGSRERYGPISAECVASCRPFELLRDEVLVAVCVREAPGGGVDAISFCVASETRARTSPVYGSRGCGRARVLARAGGGAILGLGVALRDDGSLARVDGLRDRAGAARKRLRYRDAGFSDVAAPFFDDLLPAVAKAPVLAALPRPSPEGSALQRWAFDQGLRMGVLLSLRGGSDDEDDDAA